MSPKQKCKEKILTDIQKPEGFQTLGINDLQFFIKSKVITLAELQAICHYIDLNNRACDIFDSVMKRENSVKN